MSWRYQAFAAVAASFGLGVLYVDMNMLLSRNDKKLDPKKFKDFKISAITPISSDTSLYSFDTKRASPLEGIAHVVIKDDSCQIGRSYTPIQTQPLTLLVKKYEKGHMSSLIHSKVVGDELTLCGLIPTLGVDPTGKAIDEQVIASKAIGMICGGTGITPMYQLIKQMLPKPETQLRLVYANKTLDDILLKRELDILAKLYPNFHVTYLLEHPPSGWAGRTGRVGQQDIDFVQGSSVVLVCGPPGMTEYLAGNERAPGLLQSQFSKVYKL